VPGRAGTVDIYHSAARRQYPGDHLEKRALAGAVRPNDCHLFPSVQVEGDVMQRWTPVIPKAQLLDI